MFHPDDRHMADNMTTYSISEARAHLGEVLRDLGHDDGAIIRRRGWPCGRLTAVDVRADAKPSLATLRRVFSEPPDVDYQDFRNIRAAAGRWRTR